MSQRRYLFFHHYVGDVARKMVASITSQKTGPEEAQYFHVRPPIGFI